MGRQQAAPIFYAKRENECKRKKSNSPLKKNVERAKEKNETFCFVSFVLRPPTNFFFSPSFYKTMLSMSLTFPKNAATATSVLLPLSLLLSTVISAGTGERLSASTQET